MSISSQILSQITAYRNPNGPEQEWARPSSEEEHIPESMRAPQIRNAAHIGKVLLAEVGYIVTIPVAIIETALSAIAKVFSSILPIGQENHTAMTEYLKSSSFSIIWAVGDTAINLFCNDMIQTERVARACAASGHFFQVPVDAL